MPKFDVSDDPLYEKAHFLGTVTCPYIEGGLEKDWDIYSVPPAYSQAKSKTIVAHYKDSNKFEVKKKNKRYSHEGELEAKDPVAAENFEQEDYWMYQHHRLSYPAWMAAEHYNVPLPIMKGFALGFSTNSAETTYIANVCVPCEQSEHKGHKPFRVGDEC